MTKIEKIVKTTHTKLDAPDSPSGYYYAPVKEVYVGEVKNGKPHGQGKIEKESIEDLWALCRYKGKFKEGKFHGKGILEIPATSYFYAHKYEGNFVNGVEEGYGVKITFKERVWGEGDEGTWWIYITPKVMEYEDGEINIEDWTHSREEGQFKNGKLFKGTKINYEWKNYEGGVEVEEVDESEKD